MNVNSTDPTWNSLMNDPTYGLEALIQKALSDTGAQRVADWQQIYGEIEAADPLAQAASQEWGGFGTDFDQILFKDAQSISSDPTTADLQKIQNDLTQLESDPLPPTPVDPNFYANAIAGPNGAGQKLLALLASNPQDQNEIEAMMQVLIDFAAPMGAQGMAQNILSAYQTYLETGLPSQLVEVEYLLSNFMEAILNP